MTESGAKSIPWIVKSNFITLFLACAALSPAILNAQDSPPPLAPLPQIPAGDENLSSNGGVAAPADVIASAVNSVDKLGEEVVLGRYQVAVERMNPEWKSRVAKRMGGMDKLEAQLENVAQQMMQQGITMISFKPQGRPISFEVTPGRKVETVNGSEVESLIFKKWLVLIPTSTKFRITRQGEKPLVIESVGFQAAISDKDNIDWTFIDGSGLSVSDLRSIFHTLPQDLKLPPIEKREVR